MLVAAAVACTAASTEREPAAAAGQGAKLDHVWPPRDFIGPRPEYFEWTRVEGADHYAIVVYDEIDRVSWRDDEVRDISVALADDVPLEQGTYLWTVIALDSDNRPIISSGRSAFVISR